MASPEHAAQNLESVTAELRLALDGFRRAAKTLVVATDKAGEIIPEDILSDQSRAQGTKYEELHRLWITSPGEEVFSLLGVEEES